MTKTAAIFSGARLNMTVLEESINHALETSGSLVVLYLADTAESEEFVSPLAETRTPTASYGNATDVVDPMVKTNLETILFRTSASKIKCETIVMSSPVPEELDNFFSASEVVFVERNSEQSVTLAAVPDHVKNFLRSNASKIHFV